MKRTVVRTIVGVMLVALVVVALPVSAATITAGNPEVPRGVSGIVIPIMISGNNVEMAAGMDLFLQLLDEGPPEVSPGPVFTGLTTDFSGGFFAGPLFPETVIITPPWLATAATFVLPERVVDTETLVGLLTIDTTLVPAGGIWQFRLGNTSLSGKANPTDTGNTIITTLVDGTITVVPEPAVLAQLLALVGMGGLGLFFRRRKLRG